MNTFVIRLVFCIWQVARSEFVKAFFLNKHLPAVGNVVSISGAAADAEQ